MSNAYVAKTQADLVSPAQIATMTGLAFMESVRDGTLAGPPIAGLMNFTVESVEKNRVVFRGTPKFEHSNPIGTLHGGWYGTILDSCMACAVMTTVPVGHYYTTLEYKVNITRSIPLGTEVEAIGIVQHAGRTTGVAIGEIRGVADSKLYATGSTTCIILKMP
ncbi:MAG: PaaI family thioesterase [Rhodobacteraceae bacterium]|nr:PaaI family thioesterase [Paracoccaceae bacterium]